MVDNGCKNAVSKIDSTMANPKLTMALSRDDRHIPFFDGRMEKPLAVEELFAASTLDS